MIRFESRALLTAEQMREAEQAVIQGGGATGLELMERAGTGVVAAIFDSWPALADSPGKVVVLCGPGNNGGDGFVIARGLHARGWQVELRLFGEPERLPPDARANLDRWQALGGAVLAFDDPGGVLGGAAPPDPVMIVDALFGTGLTRALPDALVAVIDRLYGAAARRPGGLPWVAVDLPSGLNSDTGRFAGRKLSADLTVTFHSMKLGHVLHDGPRHCGDIRVVDIGLSDPAVPYPVIPEDQVLHLPRPFMADRLEKAAEHKYEYGHSLVLSGPMGRTGAARLAARAALRVGAGLVTVAAPEAALAECAAQLTAIMLRPCNSAAELQDVLDRNRIASICLGPGFGMDGRSYEMIQTALNAPTRGVVLDADALTLLANAPQDWPEQLHAQVVLTPHVGEFRRLFPELTDKLLRAGAGGPAYSAVDAAREAAAIAGCTVLFKGSTTVIADQAGRCSVHAAINDRKTPWLATAGAGDVLAGLIAGLMARGLPAMEAAETGAWLHVEAARLFGPGLIAEDLPEILPKVFRNLGL